MKKIIVTSLCILAMHIDVFAQTSDKKTESFKVYGNCEMCKTTIEASLKKKDGITSKNWDINTKIITVTYYPNKITLTQIKQKIAEAGYDSDEIRATDEAYNNLHKCCQYERPGNNNSKTN